MPRHSDTYTGGTAWPYRVSTAPALGPSGAHEPNSDELIRPRQQRTRSRAQQRERDPHHRRLQLDAASHPAAVARGGSLPVDVDPRNRGWAKLFSARRLVVTLRHHGTGALLVGNGGDLGQLPAQATGSAHVTVHVPVPAGATTGTYEVLLSAPDVFASTAGDARFSVRFANADDPSRGQAFEAASAQFNVGTRVAVH